jgi:hypothetical protein
MWRGAWCVGDDDAGRYDDGDVAEVERVMKGGTARVDR